jgi:hypothetical protein
VPRAHPRGGFVASSATGAIVSATVASSGLCPSMARPGTSFVTVCLDCATAPPLVGLTDARRVAWRIASLHGRPALTRRARFRTRGAACARVRNGLVRPGRQRVNISFERYLFAICRRHEIRSQCGVVGPFPHRNGILPTFPFGIDVRHDDRAMEGFPVFP